nr:HAD hydrolase family protein [uncultured Anaerosporobacter sp.]
MFGDLGVKDISKASAIKQLLSYLNVDRADTVAFGDAKVDISMLEHCAIGVAMGNGGSEVKKIADIVTDDVECDGLYKAFKRLKLI